MEITVGWWAIPLAITVIGYWLSDRWYESRCGTGNYAAIGVMLVAVVSTAAWLVVSLVAWLIYALAT